MKGRRSYPDPYPDAALAAQPQKRQKGPRLATRPLRVWWLPELRLALDGRTSLVAQSQCPRLPLRSAVARCGGRVRQEVLHRRGNDPADVSSLLSAVGGRIELGKRFEVVGLGSVPVGLERRALGQRGGGVVRHERLWLDRKQEARNALALRAS